jgi:hypothetical protein
LHQAPNRREQAEDPGGSSIVAHEGEDILGQDRDLQPQRQHIERDGAEDEGEGAPGVHRG